MAIHKIVEFDTLMLEVDIYLLLENMDAAMAQIKLIVPDEVLFNSNGEPNVRTHWGAVYFHISMARASLRAFS